MGSVLVLKAVACKSGLTNIVSGVARSFNTVKVRILAHQIFMLFSSLVCRLFG